MKKYILTFFAVIVACNYLMAQSFTSGNIVVARLGDGTSPTTGGARGVTLLEYNSVTKVLTNTVAIPSTVAAQRLVINSNSGAGSNEGGITLSADGRYILVGGSDATLGNSNTGASNKSFARINKAGTAEVFTINTNYSSSFVRSTTSLDGSTFVFTSNTGIGFGIFGNTTNTTFGISGTGSRYLQAIGTKLYAVSGTNPATVLYFGNMPTSTAANNGTAIALTTTTGVASAYGFAMLDADVTISNTNDATDVLYIVDQTAASSGIVKLAYNTVTSTWDYIGKYNSPDNTTPFYGLAAKVVGATVELTTVQGYGDNNKLVSIVDANSRTTFSAASVTKTDIASAGANFVFRSVALSPSVSTLPLKLTSFLAVPTFNGASVKWTTAEEINVKEMTLLRKEGDDAFKVVKVVKPKGGTSINNYQVDNANLPAGTYYYQLKTTDFDGSVSESKIVSVTVKGIGLSIYPNPTSGSLSLQFSSVGANSTVKIYNMDGKLVEKIAIAPLSTAKTLDVSNYALGKYIVKVDDNGKVQTLSFIKQ